MPALKARCEKALFAACMALALAGAGGPAFAFRSQAIPIPGEIQEIRADDLGGDGQKEIFVSTNRVDGKRIERLIRVFAWPGESEPALLVPQSSWAVDPEAVFWDTGPEGSSAHPSRSLYFLSCHGLWRLPGRGAAPGKPLCQVREPLLVASSQEDGFPCLDFIRDWDGDGKEEALLPQSRKALFFRLNGNGSWELSDAAEVSPYSMYNNNVLFGRKVGSYEFLSVILFPLFEAADLNRDGRTDLLVLRDGKGLPFLRGEDGRLGGQGEPWDLDIRTAEERLRHRATLSYRVADLNRDGCADAVVHKVGVNFASWDSETAVFLGNPGGSAGGKPDLSFSSRGLLSGFSLEDLDGDGFSDLTLWSVRMGIWPMIEILLRKVVHVKAESYYGAWPPGFPEEPQTSRGFEFTIDTARPGFFSGLVPNTEADLDGDGLKDMVAAIGSDALGVYLGQPRKGFASSPWKTVEEKGVARMNYVRVEDLDGDGLCDLMAYEAHKDLSVLHVWTRR
ncbi:MAG: VCBS repeat-containing protein [bacterium]